MAFAGRLLADALSPVNDRWLESIQPQPEAELLGHGLQRLLVSLPLGRPVSVPDALACKIGARNPGSTAIEPLPIVKPFSIDIGKRQMCQVQVVYTPGRLVLSSAAPLRLTKENELEAKTLALCIP